MHQSFLSTAPTPHPHLPLPHTHTTGLVGDGRANDRGYYFLNIPAVPCKCRNYDFAPVLRGLQCIVVELAEERACFTRILSMSWPSFIRVLTTRSRENKIAVTIENESEKSSTNIYTHPISLSFFFETEIR